VTEFLTAGGLILTVLLAYMQIQKQHGNALRLQAEHLRNKLKVQIYHEITAHLHKTARAQGRATSSYRSAVTSLRSNHENPAIQLTQTSNGLRRAHERASRSVSSLLILFEKYEIVFAHFGSIQRQFGDEHRRLLDANWKLTGKLMMYLPMDDLPAETKTVFPLKAKRDDLSELEEMVSEYLSVLEELEGYILDVQVEAQNELLGNLFGRVVPQRNPADPDVKVLQRDAEPRTERPKGRWV
jgi:hypothetical protein